MGFASSISSRLRRCLSRATDLVAGSLAVGAKLANRDEGRPDHASGIFSAIMVGFGRAVGETMIVLMATGNTPILDWSPFNGFRTLSANIAVEIPEAPHGGTLYRTLFLAALLPFVLTFAVNTVAEVVRQPRGSTPSRGPADHAAAGNPCPRHHFPTAPRISRVR